LALSAPCAGVDTRRAMAKVPDFRAACSTSDLQMQTEKVDPFFSMNSTVVDILIAAEQTLRIQCLSKENNNRGGTNGGVLPDEGQRARFPVNSVTRDSIRSLVTRVEVVPRGIDIKAARIVASGPFLSGKGEYSTLTDREPSDAVMQPVRSIKKSCVRRDHNLRRKIGPFEVFRQS